MDKVIIKLAKKDTSFYDGSQSDVESQKLVGGQVKVLDKTPYVKLLMDKGALVVADKKELEDYNASIKSSKVVVENTDNSELLAELELANSTIENLTLENTSLKEDCLALEDEVKKLKEDSLKTKGK